MSSFLLPIAGLRQPDLERWRELAGRALEDNPFFEPQFALPAAAGLGDDTVRLLVVAGSGGDWLGCMPVSFASRWKRLPVPALGGWRHKYCFLGTPLVAPDDPERALTGLVDLAFDSGDRARMLALEWLRDDGPLAPAIRHVMEARPRRALKFEAFERASLGRRPAADYLDTTLRPHHRREMRRLGRRLADELGAPLELRDRSQDESAVDDFTALEAAGWKGRMGTAFGADHEHEKMFRAVCSAFRAEGRLQLLALMAGDRPAAFKCNLLTRDEVFCFKIAYDESLSRFSPGVQLEHRMVELFHDDMTQAQMDSCADSDSDMINRLWPDRRPLVSYAVPAAGAGGWAALRTVDAAFQIHNRLRRAS